MNPYETNRLIDALLEGEISEADFLSLEAELTVDPQVRQEYYDRCALSLLLEMEAEQVGVADSKKALPNAARSIPPRLALLGMTIAVSLLAVAGWLLVFGSERGASNEQDPLAEEQQVDGYASIVGQLDAIWQNGDSMATGSVLGSGEYQLASGVVQLELFSGVTVVIEGETTFTLRSPMELIVESGKIRANVPPAAQGFRVVTADGEIVDLGTDFAVEVANDNTKVHVLEGEVEWHSESRSVNLITQGQSIDASATDGRFLLNAIPLELLSIDRFRERMQLDRTGRLEEWKRYRAQLQKDPRLIALYQLGKSTSWHRRLANDAVGPAAAGSEAAIVAAVPSADRWGEAAGGLDFSPAGSRIRLTVPAELGSLTLMCWVKINSLDRWYNSLFLTDGHDLHEPHWQIMDDGRLFFSVKKRDRWNPARGEKDKHIYYSPALWKNELSGQWLMIATVYDIQAMQVTHFLNGKAISEEAIPAEYLVERVQIGNASIGNWGLPERDEPRFAVRNLNGSMDEFALFGAALAAEEILELYEIGKP